MFFCVQMLDPEQLSCVQFVDAWIDVCSEHFEHKRQEGA